MGSGILSITGAQTNLKPYPSAAQLKYVIVALATSASRSQTDSVLKINRIGTPAEKPRNSIAITRR